jgi:acyl carrier protein
LSIVNEKFPDWPVNLPTIDTMPTISSRTPDGSPGRCPICGQMVLIEVSGAFGDAPCPHCGCLLRFVRAAGETYFVDPGKLRRFLADRLGISEAQVGDDFADLQKLGLDSLDTLELVLELEEFERETGDNDPP